MRIVDDATSLTAAAKVNILVGLTNVEHFGALVSVKNNGLVEMINCIK